MMLRLLNDADMPELVLMANSPANKAALASNDLEITASDMPGLLLDAMPGTYSKAYSWNELNAVITINNISEVNRSATIGALAVNPRLTHTRAYIEARNAVTAALDHAFNGIGLNRVDCRVIEGNRLTPLICKKLGCKTDGVLRQAVWRKGQFKDLTVYSLLAEEFRGTQDGGRR